MKIITTSQISPINSKHSLNAEHSGIGEMYKRQFGESGLESVHLTPINSAIKCSHVSQNNSLNISNKKTAKNVNFSGLSIEEGKKLLTELQKKKAFSMANQKTLKNFWKLAKENQAVFEALFALFITCGLRPAAIAAQSNEKNKEKNKKAASHSISSGIIGYGFALAVFSPIKKGLDRLRENPEKYMSKKTMDYFTHCGKKFMKSSPKYDTFAVLLNYGTQAFTASIRSAITIGMIPIIDKYVLNKIFKKAQLPEVQKQIDNDPTYNYQYINFKNAKDQKVFQNFAGVMK